MVRRDLVRFGALGPWGAVGAKGGADVGALKTGCAASGSWTEADACCRWTVSGPRQGRGARGSTVHAPPGIPTRRGGPPPTVRP